MKKRMIVSALAIVIASCCIWLCGCEFTPYIVKTAKTEGDFVYNIAEEDGVSYAILLDFSDTGKEKEVIIVPESIGGAKIRFFNRLSGFWGATFGAMKSDALKRIYFPHDVIFLHGCFRNCPNVERVLCFEPEVQPASDLMRFPRQNGEARGSSANVTYRIGDDIYWIDDYAYGTEITVAPPEPEMEGTRFAGWYKDPGFTEKWDFGSDTLPEAEYDQYGQEIYKETVLYGKLEAK